MSVVAATPQAHLLYVEQAPLVTHPAPLVVQLLKIELQALSDVNETGSKSQFNFMHCNWNPQKEGIGLH